MGDEISFLLTRLQNCDLKIMQQNRKEQIPCRFEKKRERLQTEKGIRRENVRTIFAMLSLLSGMPKNRPR